MRALSLVAILVAAVFAGCISGPETNVPPTSVVTELLAGEALWADPQNAPHPAYGWPTLSSPPNATDLPDFWKPIEGAALPTDIKGIEQIARTTEDVKSGAGIAIFGSIAYVPGYSNQSYVVDISDPLAPALLGIVEVPAAQRGAATIAYPNGTLVAVVSTGPGFDVVDISDPTRPEILTNVTPTEEGHKLGVVPGTPIVYNAGSWGGSSTGYMGEGHLAQTAARHTSIYDLSDPTDPKLVQEFQNGFSCHHIFFWNNPAEDKYRAVCAGIEYTQIWDTKDPKDPKVIVNIPVHHGVAETPSGSVFLMAFSHFSILSQDGKTLIVGDEMGGGAVPPGCGAHASVAGRDASTPFGALWFYDVSDETNPVLKGWFSPGIAADNLVVPSGVGGLFGNSCTAHHGRIIPAEGRDLIALAFYRAGVAIVDFTDPTSPVLVDQFKEGTETWEVWYNNGYLFTGDLARGLDVLKFE